MDILVVASEESLNEIISHSLDKLNVELEINHIHEGSDLDFDCKNSYDLVIVRDKDFAEYPLKLKTIIFSKILQKGYPVVAFLENEQRFDVFCGLNLNDYFYEPVDYQRLSLRLNQCKDHLMKCNSPIESNKFVVKQKNEVIFIDYSDIIFFEKDSKKLYVHLADRTIIVQESLKVLMERLPNSFARVHNSYVVNVKYISKIIEVGNRSYEIIFDQYEKKALMSRYRSKALLKGLYKIG